MEQELLSSQPSLSTEPSRHGDLRSGILLEIVTIIWMVIEAGLALSAGFASRSFALQGFGLDSLIELLAGGILLWRLLVEQRGGSVERIEQAERRASWITAFALFTLALYLVGGSLWSLFAQVRPEESWWGVGLAVGAALIMPLLWQGKLRIARSLGSPALKADAACSATCAYMSVILLVGLLLNHLLGWWWADPLASVALVFFLLREGQEALHEARTGEHCSCADEMCDGSSIANR